MWKRDDDMRRAGRKGRLRSSDPLFPRSLRSLEIGTYAQVGPPGPPRKPFSPFPELLVSPPLILRHPICHLPLSCRHPGPSQPFPSSHPTPPLQTKLSPRHTTRKPPKHTLLLHPHSSPSQRQQQKQPLNQYSDIHSWL
ncbi:hypothetical protein CGRA01v4_05034 [Colletotrichum graminicola]|nr:hypothetical protein CGRA01v4_05034 [Colletotrichum graminicola]